MSTERSQRDTAHESDARSIFDRWIAGRRSGGTIEFEELLRVHPALEGELRALRQRFEGVAELLRQDGPPSGEAVGSPSTLDRELGWVSASQRQELEELYPGLLDGLDRRRLRFERFELAAGDEAQLGEGGMGVVVRAWDLELERPVALKFLKRGSARFLREARVTAKLDHPGVVPIHELGLDRNGRPYYAMRLVEGLTLEQVFEQRRKSRESEWTSTKIVGVLQRACQTLAFAHERGVVHRDLKPQNIMVGRFGEVYVVDWGLAAVAGERAECMPTNEAATQEGEAPKLTRAGQILGTLEYMSPEQARGEWDRVGAASDVYAMGAVLYELLAGAPPFSDVVESGATANERSLAILRAVRSGQPTSLSEMHRQIPSELVSICEKAMAFSAAERYPDMAVLAADLAAYLELRVVTAHEAGPWAEAKKWIRRNKTLAGALGLAIGTAVAGVLVYVVMTNERLVLTNQGILDANRHNARLAAERGAWRSVLQTVETLKPLEPDPTEAMALECEAWIALAEPQEAERSLAALEAVAKDGSARAKYLVLKATHLSATYGRADECLAAAEQALAAGLDGADAAFARALVAPTSKEAFAALDETLQLKPYHRQANYLKGALLVLTGRFEDAVDHLTFFARLYPEDYEPHAGLAISLAMLHRPEEARRALDRLGGRLGDDLRAEFEEACSVFELVADLPADTFLGNPGGATAAIMTRANPVAAKAKTSSGELAPPSMRCLRDSYGAVTECILGGQKINALEAVVAIAMSMRTDPAKILGCFEDAASHLDDALFSYVCGASIECLRSAAWPDELRLFVQYDHFQRAAERHSFVSQIPRASKCLAARILRDLVVQYGHSELRGLVDRTPFEYLILNDPTQLESIEYAGIAADLGLGEAAREIMRAARLRFPTNFDLQLAAADIDVRTRQFDDALSRYDEILSRDPSLVKRKTEQRGLIAAQNSVCPLRDRAVAARDQWLRSQTTPPLH